MARFAKVTGSALCQARRIDAGCGALLAVLALTGCANSNSAMAPPVHRRETKEIPAYVSDTARLCRRFGEKMKKLNRERPMSIAGALVQMKMLELDMSIVFTEFGTEIVPSSKDTAFLDAGRGVGDLLELDDRTLARRDLIHYARAVPGSEFPTSAEFIRYRHQARALERRITVDMTALGLPGCSAVLVN